MLTYTNAVYPTVQPAVNPYWGAVSEWRTGPFTANLRIIRFERGRSAAHFIWADAAGHEYTMFGKFLLDTVQEHDLSKGWLSGTWDFAKRGANYSIIKLGS